MSGAAFSEPFYVPWDLITPLLPRLAAPLAVASFFESGQQGPDQAWATRVALRDPQRVLDVLSVPNRDSSEALTGRLLVVSVTLQVELDRPRRRAGNRSDRTYAVGGGEAFPRKR